MSPLPLIAIAKIATPFIARTAIPYISRVAIPMVARNINKIAPSIGKTVVQQVTKGKYAMVSATNLAKNNISSISAHARNKTSSALSSIKSSTQYNWDKTKVAVKYNKDLLSNPTNPTQNLGILKKTYDLSKISEKLSEKNLKDGEKILKDRLSILDRETKNIEKAFKEERLLEYGSSLVDRIKKKDAEYVKGMLKNNATLLDIASTAPIGYKPYNIAIDAASILNCNVLAGVNNYTNQTDTTGLAKEVWSCVFEPTASKLVDKTISKGKK